jgi:hypothetical protein
MKHHPNSNSSPPFFKSLLPRTSGHHLDKPTAHTTNALNNNHSPLGLTQQEKRSSENQNQAKTQRTTITNAICI